MCVRLSMVVMGRAGSQVVSKLDTLEVGEMVHV